MTEAQKCLYHIAENMRMDKSISKEGYEYFQQAIKALEQESCENAISREKAKQFLYERLNRLNNDELYDIFSRIIDDMYNELPSVTPQQKIGYWTRELIINEYGGCIGAKMICSECGQDNGYDKRMKFCPNCGAKMEVGE